MVELVDTLVSGTSASRHACSSQVPGRLKTPKGVFFLCLHVSFYLPGIVALDLNKGKYFFFTCYRIGKFNSYCTEIKAFFWGTVRVIAGIVQGSFLTGS